MEGKNFSKINIGNYRALPKYLLISDGENEQKLKKKSLAAGGNKLTSRNQNRTLQTFDENRSPFFPEKKYSVPSLPSRNQESWERGSCSNKNTESVDNNRGEFTNYTNDNASDDRKIGKSNFIPRGNSYSKLKIITKNGSRRDFSTNGSEKLKKPFLDYTTPKTTASEVRDHSKNQLIGASSEWDIFNNSNIDRKIYTPDDF